MSEGLRRMGEKTGASGWGGFPNCCVGGKGIWYCWAGAGGDVEEDEAREMLIPPSIG